MRQARDPDRAVVQQITHTAERMLDLHNRLSAARTDQEKTALQRQIADTDRRIDRLVYDLYELTAEEIQLVENNGGTARA